MKIHNYRGIRESVEASERQPLITIIIPTYNRAVFLGRLLERVNAETRHLDVVKVIVLNNASTDDSSQVLERFKVDRPDWLIIEHEANCGPDANFIAGIKRVETPYIWIIGDDDMPRQGVISHVVQILEQAEPDLLYLSSEWLDDVGVNRLSPQFDGGKIVDRDGFAQAVNVWVTFISGMIVNLSNVKARNPAFDPNRYNGTSLVHLGWVLPALINGEKFVIVDQQWVLATKENSRGYKLITVLGGNLTRIVEEVCGKHTSVAKAILGGAHWSYLPRLIWDTRRNRVDNFDQEDVMEAIDGLRSYPAYRWVLLPMEKLPLYLAGVLFLSLAVVRKFDGILVSKLGQKSLFFR